MTVPAPGSYLNLPSSAEVQARILQLKTELRYLKNIAAYIEMIDADMAARGVKHNAAPMSDLAAIAKAAEMTGGTMDADPEPAPAPFDPPPDATTDRPNRRQHPHGAIV